MLSGLIWSLRGKRQRLFLLRTARKGESMKLVDVASIAASVGSVVGASKMLHFVNPKVYPIWDSRMETLRLGSAPGINHMGSTESY